VVLRHSGASLERGKKITLPPLPLDFDLKTQNRDHPSFKNARVRQGCAPPNPKTPRIWGFHFCHHLRMAKTGTLLTCTYFALPPPHPPRVNLLLSNLINKPTSSLGGLIEQESIPVIIQRDHLCRDAVMP